MSIELTSDQLAERVRWIRKLLSDEYDQQTGALAVYCPKTDKTGYCCLGVYEHMCNPQSTRLGFHNNQTNGQFNPAFTRALDGCYESDEGTLDSEGQERLGFSKQDHEAAYELNDEKHWTFAQIARGLAWTTSMGLPFYELLFTKVEPEDPFDVVEYEQDMTPVPDDFDLDAWLAEVDR